MVNARVCSLTRTSHCESPRISAPKRRPAPVLFFFSHPPTASESFLREEGLRSRLRADGIAGGPFPFPSLGPCLRPAPYPSRGERPFEGTSPPLSQGP